MRPDLVVDFALWVAEPLWLLLAVILAASVLLTYGVSRWLSAS
jgi:hypothetical protein